MADGKGDGNGNGWRQHKRDGGSDGQWRLQQQWPTAMAMAIGYGNVNSIGNGDSKGDGDGNSNCNGDSHSNSDNDKGRVASSCAGNVQRCGRGNTLPPPPWTQRKVHSPALRHGGDTAKSVCSLYRGRVPDSSPWIFVLFTFTAIVQFTEEPSVCPLHYSGAQESCQPIDALPPPLLQEPCRPIDNLPQLLLHFFVKVSPGRACNDYNITFLCWCEMTNLSSTFFISKKFPLSLTEHTKIHLKSLCCDSWDIQGQSLSCGFKALSCTTLLPVLGACICLATFL